MTLKYEDLKNFNPGDQIVIKTPIGNLGGPYVYVKLDDTTGIYYFRSAAGSLLAIRDQKSIDSFNVEKIDKNHAMWDQKASDMGKEFWRMMEDLK